ncbi:MAG: hypothetical protein QM709_11650 [Spongiibacteraceae bacterium]
MEQNRFFNWISRINSILFLLLLAVSLAFVIFLFLDSNHWARRNQVEVADKASNEQKLEDLRLSDIQAVCGTNVQYVKLTSQSSSKGFSSGGYDSSIRNIIFFEGEDLKSHWLFDSNSFVIETMDVLEVDDHDCKGKKATSIYYETIKSDSNGDGRLSSDDQVSIGITDTAGLNYKELDSGLTSVIDHNVSNDGSQLNILVQQGNIIKMKKFFASSGELISETEISRIRKEN